MSTTTTTTPDTSTVTLNAEAAESMHTALVKSVRDFVKARRDVIALVKEAQKSNLAEVRGFSSWADYAAATVAESLPKNAPKDVREWVGVLLIHCGVSTRAAAAAVGSSQPTMSRRANGPVAEEVAEEVAAVTGDKADAVKATVTTTKEGKTQTREATRGKGKTPDADKASAPKSRDSRTPKALAEEAAAVIVAQWHNLTVEQRVEIADMILCLPAQAE